ncbi:MAG: type II toxin-antitoxin system HicA family toxin [Ktedonobacteraceae bacterium]
MSPKQPRITGIEVIRALKRAGWLFERQHGSHVYLKHPDLPGLRVTVAVHSGEIVKPKTLQSILKQAGLSIDEFRELL